MSPKGVGVNIGVVGPPLTNAELEIDGVVPSSMTLKIATPNQAKVVCIDSIAPRITKRPSKHDVKVIGLDTNQSITISNSSESPVFILDLVTCPR
jgi:hydrogenase maturation factor